MYYSVFSGILIRALRAQRGKYVQDPPVGIDDFRCVVEVLKREGISQVGKLFTI